jgi:hypothetical protein
MTKPDPNALVSQLEGKKLPPVEHWNPPLSGAMDMRIARDGTWYHEGSPIRRDSLVRLFSTILRRDQDGHYYLLTPVEKWRIQVEGAPFLAVLLDVAGRGENQLLTFQTNVGDRVCAGAEHVIEVEYNQPDGEPSPYLHVRGRLRALIARAVFLELAELAVAGVNENNGEPCYGVWSQGVFFPLGPVEEDSPSP